MEQTLRRFGIKSVEPKASENLADVASVILDVVAVDEDIVQIYRGAHIDEVVEYVVHEPLERGRSIGETFGDDQPLEGTIAGTEGDLPLIAVGDPD